MDVQGGVARVRGASRGIGRATGIAALALLLPLGCATTSLERQTWARVETPRFEVVSSLGRAATYELAQDLETFRRAVEFAASAPLGAPPVRTRVYAFDGRGFSRPFGKRGEPSYFLPSLDGGVIVLRTGDGWRDGATQALRHDYAHYLLRNLDGLERPLWYDEGLAQFASTIDVSDGRAQIGLPREDHVRLLRDRGWVSLDRVLKTPDLEEWGSRNRSLYHAQTWAFVHSRIADYGDRGRLRRELSQYEELLAGGARHDRAVQRAFGDPATLQKQLTRYVRQARLDSVSIRVKSPWQAEAAGLHPLTQDEVLTELGWLSITLGRSTQADRYLEAAGRLNPRSARTEVGLGAAATLRKDWAAARPHYERALTLAPDDPQVLLEVARFHLAQAELTRAEQSNLALSRARLTDLARKHLLRARELDPSRPATHAALATAYLLGGGDAAQAQASLERASGLLPSSLEIELLRARLSLEQGRPLAARRGARNVRARTHSQGLAEDAGQLLDEIEARQSPNARAARN